MQSLGFNLANGYTSGAPATQGPISWPGGRAAFVIAATGFATTTKLQLVYRGGFTIDILTNPTNGIYILDLPAGQYQLSMAGGAANNVNADLCSVRYG